MIVCKFGGSSLSDASQIKQVCSIVLENPERKIMVVSAPGVRKNVIPDRKVTDILLSIIEETDAGRDAIEDRRLIEDRLHGIAKGLGLPDVIATDLSTDINRLASQLDPQNRSTRDALVAMGEVSSAQLIAAYLQMLGHRARYVDPREAGLTLTYQASATVILPETYENLAPLSLTDEIIVFPGFFGVTPEGKTITFSRGGSDITGAILAAAVNARLYENWTDRDSVFAVNPEFIADAVPLGEMSYREMRELAYIGFSIIHHEALEPVMTKDIPIHIKNTNEPSSPGTRIIKERTHIDRIVTGIAAADNFCSVNLRRILINQEVGILSKILTIFAELGINVHHVPTGIDSVSIVIREEQLPLEIELALRQRLDRELGLRQVTVVRQLSIIMLVGEGIRDTVGVMARAMTAMAKEQISVEMVILDYFEISMVFLMRHYERQRAVSALYREFFENGLSLQAN
ncbi:MAG TPA: aspartate kinase [Clostridiaceae bacterium]|jgi:aspartate kinase|nr:aspartate kinase [Clostridiaceae bacterium]